MVLLWRPATSGAALQSSVFTGENKSRAELGDLVEREYYWVQLVPGQTLTTEYYQRVGRLLQASLNNMPFGQEWGEVIGWRIPRRGLISPWSTKATDILVRAGLGGVIQRVERCHVIMMNGSSEGESSDARSTSPCDLDLYDPLTQMLVPTADEARSIIFSEKFDKEEDVTSDDQPSPQPIVQPAVQRYDLNRKSLARWNLEERWSLNQAQIQWLEQHYKNVSQSPTDAEIKMFIEVNSEHCRHRIFRSIWQIMVPTKPEQKNSVINHPHESWPHESLHEYPSLFSMIQATTDSSPQRVLSAYSDNAAVMRGHKVSSWQPWGNPEYTWHFSEKVCDIVLKVETHNHPTGIAPYPGAATGVGGEIRDEVATGRGADTGAGVSGFCVSHLKIPDHPQPWEESYLDDPQPPLVMSPLEIMKQAPLGAADYGNEYGRPLIAGFFRSLEIRCSADSGAGEGDSSSDDLNGREKAKAEPIFWRGYYKPLMICGGVGSVSRRLIKKHQAGEGDLLVTIGGPAMKIGLGGGSLSSQASSQGDPSSREKDWASVQRENPEMQRRVLGVIQALAFEDAILSIHDVGAGGWANALPELVHDSGGGARISLSALPCADHTMLPWQIWCNEAQERYVLTLRPEHLSRLRELCERERAPHAVIGKITSGDQLTVTEDAQGDYVVDMPLRVLLGFREGPLKAPPLGSQQVGDSQRGEKDEYRGEQAQVAAFALLRKGAELDWAEELKRVLRRPEVGDKSFLLTIADRSVGGLTYLEPMIGPWQVPVADAGVVMSSYTSVHGRVMAVGERAGVAVVNPGAASRLAGAEAIMNALCADVPSLELLTFSANWQMDFSHHPDRWGLYEAVQSLSEFCQNLGIAVPVGKDSMSMGVQWETKGKPKNYIQSYTKNNAKSKAKNKTKSDKKEEKFSNRDCSSGHACGEHNTQQFKVSSPITLVITAVAPVEDVRKTLTPQLKDEDSFLLWLHLGGENFRLGGSSWEQSGGVHDTHIIKNPANEPRKESQVPDVSSEVLIEFSEILRWLKNNHNISAYHDVSDGGVLVTALEMALASRRSLDLNFSGFSDSLSPHQVLFAEELGALVQVPRGSREEVCRKLATLQHLKHHIIATMLPKHQKARRDEGYYEGYYKGQKHNIAPRLSVRWLPVTGDGEEAEGQELFSFELAELARHWSFQSYAIKAQRDGEACARAEWQWQMDLSRGGLFCQVDDNDDHSGVLHQPMRGLDAHLESRPRMAILREQGINGHAEMAFAFYASGFEAVDVTMSDLLSKKVQLSSFQGFVACGGFSYGDVLGAGAGWAGVIAENEILRRSFKEFFENSKTFGLGVCNGAQMLTHLRSWIGGAQNWPQLVTNESGRFESRTVMVEITSSPSIFWRKMSGWKLPVIVAHGQGRAAYSGVPGGHRHIGLRYIDHQGKATMEYPDNPAGSQLSVAGVTSDDGRFSVMMPHPERCFHSIHYPWYSRESEGSPWSVMFASAYDFAREQHHQS